MDIDKLKREIETERKQKDEFFKSGYQSPVSQEEKEHFKGLNYYPPVAKYRFELELFGHDSKDFLEIEDTKGNMRKFVRWGEFRFDVNGVKCKLQVYKSEEQDERLFVPFKDLTSGKATYGAGRYLDLESGRDIISGNKWTLDFNKAYNPWCAYSKNYACPFTPPENWLKVAIYAGEKSYSH